VDLVILVGRRRESNPRLQMTPSAYLSANISHFLPGFKHYFAVIRLAMRFCKTPISTRMNAARSNSKVEMAGSIGSIS